MTAATVIIVATWGSALVEERLAVRPEIPVVRISAHPADDPRTRARLTDWRGAQTYFHGIRKGLQRDLIDHYALVPIPYERIAAGGGVANLERLEEEIARLYARLDQLSADGERPHGSDQFDWGGLSNQLRRLQACQGKFIAAETERRLARIRVDEGARSVAHDLLGRYGHSS